MMRPLLILAVLVALVPCDAAFAQLAGTGNYRIVWEVKNRFRLFRNESDFLRQVAASRGDGVLAAERRLERDSGGYGWAKDVVANLCIDKAGNLLESCERDGERENYLAPRDHRIGVALSGNLPPGQICAWAFDDGEGALRQQDAPCEQEIQLRVRYGRTTVATVDIPLGDGTAQRVVSEIAVRDLLVAGLGDSIAAGEGNPDKAVELQGSFCFKRFLGGGPSQYFRPSRAGFSGDRSCENGPTSATTALDWAHHGARWMNPACHRSLYSYQVRTMLALAVEQPHIAVTLLPLACTGATIETGMFDGQRADDCPWVVGIDTCSGRAPAQLGELKDLLAAARKQNPQRSLDMILLTVGANDVNFAGLVANVIVDATTERLILRQGGALATPQDSQKILDADLPDEFTRLRGALKPFLNGNLSRVVFVTYGNPAMQSETQSCASGRDGFDVHPGFSVDKDRMRAAAQFVETKFLPGLKVLATCDASKICRDPLNDRMTFVDAHQQAFLRHGVCAHGPEDPEFDRACFSRTGDSFQNQSAAADDPMACSQAAGEYRPYASRARWIRTANDSYFTAMTYPEGMPALLKPSDIHDAMWGVLSAVYGGAVHPTAEGYAAMADAALPVAREVLGLPTLPAVRAEPLPPPAPPAPLSQPLSRTP